MILRSTTHAKHLTTKLKTRLGELTRTVTPRVLQVTVSLAHGAINRSVGWPLAGCGAH
jgi:hypothetical protein